MTRGGKETCGIDEGRFVNDIANGSGVGQWKLISQS